MRLPTILCATALPLIVATCLTPLAGRAASADESKCVANDGSFKTTGSQNWFEVVLSSTRAAPQMCTVQLSVLDVGGVHTGKKMLRISSSKAGKATNATYRLKTAGAGGTANLSVQCRSV